MLKVNPQTLPLTLYFILNTLKNLGNNILYLISICELVKLNPVCDPYWIKKGRVMPKRDYKGHPVFMGADLKKIKEWKDKLEEV